MSLNLSTSNFSSCVINCTLSGRYPNAPRKMMECYRKSLPSVLQICSQPILACKPFQPVLSAPPPHSNSHATPQLCCWKSLSGLLEKASELTGVKWGARAGIRGGGGKMFLESGAGTTILDWLSGEARPGQYAELELAGAGENAFD